MAKKTYDDVPVIWRSTVEHITESFGEEFATEWTKAFDAHDAKIAELLARASASLKAPQGKETVAFHGRGRSMGIKFLEPTAAAEAKPKPKSAKPSFEEQLASMGATLVKRGQTMKDAGVTSTPVITGKAKRA